MLVELGLVEQRYQAVLEVLRGAPVTEVARRYGVVRQTVHGWLRRYGTEGLAGLADRSSKPLSCPHQTPAEIGVRISASRLSMSTLQRWRGGVRVAWRYRPSHGELLQLERLLISDWIMDRTRQSGDHGSGNTPTCR